MTAIVSIGDIAVFALCVGLGIAWVSIIHHFLRDSDEGHAADYSDGSPAGSRH